MRRVFALIAVLAWGCGSFVPDVVARGGGLAEAAFDQIVAKFDALEAASVDVETWKTFTNEHGSLAWGTSYLLEAYLDMYEATKSPSYLNKFIILANALANQTDARRELADYKGRKRVGWGAVAYSKAGERVVWLVHTGMIAYPLVRFALIVSQTPSLNLFLSEAVHLRRLAEAALREFDGQWRYDPSNGVGHYVFEDSEPLKKSAGPGTPVPFNQQLAAGRTFIVLWKLTGDSVYQQKAEGMAQHFKRHLRVDSTGAYEWDHWYGKGLVLHGSREDISHGAIDLNFVVEAARHSFGFTRNDLTPFASTFFRETNVSDGKMLKPSDAVGRWLELAEVECGVYCVVMPYLMSMAGTQHSQVLLGVAKLAKYAAICARS